MDSKKIISIVGIVASGISAIAGFVCNLANERKTEYMIDEKIDKKFKAIAESNEEESE